MHIPFRSDGEWGLFNNVQCFYFFFLLIMNYLHHVYVCA